MSEQNYIVEITDTFGGEANYSWVKRFTLDDLGLKFHEVTDRKILRRLRSLGHIGKVKNAGLGRYNLVGCCACLFIMEEY